MLATVSVDQVVATCVGVCVSVFGFCCRAVADGVRLTHFFAWSFTDNWEWKEGFGTRFGLVRLCRQHWQHLHFSSTPVLPCVA